MRGAITLVLTLVLLVVIGLDGYGMLGAFMDSRELALGAAQTAATTLERSGSEGVVRAKLPTPTWPFTARNCFNSITASRWLSGIRLGYGWSRRRSCSSTSRS